MTRRPIRVLGKWQLVYGTDKLFELANPLGWRRSNLGLVRFTSFPAEGVRTDSANYDGIWLRWRWWFPMERDR